MTARGARRGAANALSTLTSQHRVDRFIGGIRLAFTLCALLAVIVDPSEPPRNAPHVFTLMIAYAFYSLATVKPDGFLTSQTTTTDAKGNAVVKLRLKRQDPRGTYQVTSKATVSTGVTGQAAARFVVQSQAIVQ